MTGIDFAAYSIDMLLDGYRQRRFAPSDVLYYFLDRINRFDMSGPRLNAISQLDPEAIAMACRADRLAEDGKICGALFGIPMLIKENMATRGAMETTAGALALKGLHTKEDSAVVKRLREAGAIIMGKTNMTELANYMAEAMPNGYSSLGGQVISPYPGQKDAGGSSTGSAVAVAAGLCTAALGTETAGSIINPSCKNGVVGIKPPAGRVNASGIIPIAPSLDVPGPIARNVDDAVAVYRALLGADGASHARSWEGDMILGFSTSALEGLSEDEISIFARAKSGLSSICSQTADVDGLGRGGYDHTLMDYEFYGAFSSFMAGYAPYHPIKNVEKLVGFNRANAERCLRYGQTVLEECLEMANGARGKAAYLQALLYNRRQTKNGIARIMGDMGLDVLAVPMTTGIPAYSGYAAIQLPVGITKAEGRPVGLTLISPPEKEYAAYALAREYEKRYGGWRMPPALEQNDA